MQNAALNPALRQKLEHLDSIDHSRIHLLFRQDTIHRCISSILEANTHIQILIQIWAIVRKDKWMNRTYNTIKQMLWMHESYNHSKHKRGVQFYLTTLQTHCYCTWAWQFTYDWYRCILLNKILPPLLFSSCCVHLCFLNNHSAIDSAFIHQ